MLLVIQHVVSAPVDGVTKPEVPPHAMLYLLVPTVGMVKFMNVMLVISVLVQIEIKRHVHQDRTHRVKSLFRAFLVRPVLMRILAVPYTAKIATMTNINRIQMQQDV
jgi:hypothetical protein